MEFGAVTEAPVGITVPVEAWCLSGAPWRPEELGNLFWDRVYDPTSPAERLTVSVDHWRAEDRLRALAGIEDVTRFPGEHHVTVFHPDVDPLTRVCAACGTVVGAGAR